MDGIKRKIALYFFLCFFLAEMIAISISAGIFFVFRGIASYADAVSHDMLAAFCALTISLALGSLVPFLVSKAQNRIFHKVFCLSRDSKITTFFKHEICDFGLLIISTTFFI